MSATKSLLKVFIIVVVLITALYVRNGISQEDYPNRFITMIVPSTPGMGDTMVRAVCKVAEKKLGQPIVVENKPGASGAIGIGYYLKSKPDGYTLGMAATSHITIIPHIQKLPFNPLTDCTDICALYKYNHGLAVRSDAPWNTYEDVIAYARKNPGKFTYANAYTGTTQHLIMEMISMKEGIKWTMVVFKGGPESAMAALGGHTDAVTQGSADILPHIKAGKLKMLLSLNDFRWSSLPNVPNMVEKGYDFYALNYNTFQGPTGMPEPVRQKLENVFKESLKDPSFIELANKLDVKIQFMSGKEYSALWRSKYDQMGKVVKSLGL